MIRPWRHRLDPVERGEQVHGDRLTERLGVQVLDFPGPAEPGVVDEHVDPAEGLHRQVNRRAKGRLLAHVPDERPDPRGRDLLETFGIPIDPEHERAVSSEPQGQGPPDPAGRTSDDDRPTGDLVLLWLFELHGTLLEIGS